MPLVFSIFQSRHSSGPPENATRGMTAWRADGALDWAETQPSTWKLLEALITTCSNTQLREREGQGERGQSQSQSQSQREGICR